MIDIERCVSARRHFKDAAYAVNLAKVKAPAIAAASGVSSSPFGPDGSLDGAFLLNVLGSLAEGLYCLAAALASAAEPR